MLFNSNRGTLGSSGRTFHGQDALLHHSPRDHPSIVGTGLVPVCATSDAPHVAPICSSNRSPRGLGRGPALSLRELNSQKEWIHTWPLPRSTRVFPHRLTTSPTAFSPRGLPPPLLSIEMSRQLTNSRGAVSRPSRAGEPEARVEAWARNWTPVPLSTNAASLGGNGGVRSLPSSVPCLAGRRTPTALVPLERREVCTIRDLTNTDQLALRWPPGTKAGACNALGRYAKALLSYSP